MSVYKRPGSKTFSYDFEFQGARYTGNTEETSKRQAEQFVDSLRKSLKAARAQSTKPMSFGGAWSLYWEQVGQFHRNNTDTLRAMDWLQKQIGRTTMISTISEADVARLVSKRRGETVGKTKRLVSAATVNRSVLEPLRSILKRARKVWGQSVQNIEWKNHFLKEPQERIREATVQEESSLLATIRPDYAPVVRFAVLTGCRISEILGLEWARVDFFNRSFSVTGKGDKTRSIPITSAVYALLWELKDHHPTAVFTYIAWKTRGDRVEGQRYPITENGFKTQWRRVKRDSGVTDFRFHDTRHTAATRLVRRTGNLKLAQKMLGHTDLATTSRYSHVTDEDLRAGMEATIPTEIPAQEGVEDDKALENKGNVV